MNVVIATTRSDLREALFLAPSVGDFLFLYEIVRESLNGFAPNSHGRRVWFLAWTSLKVKVKGQRSMSPWTKRHFHAALSAAMREVHVW